MAVWIKRLATKLKNLNESLGSGGQICPICGERGKLNPICLKCATYLEMTEKQEFCRRCGRFIADKNHLSSDTKTCHDCISEAPAFVEARAVAPYNAYAKELIYKLKYTGVQSLAEIMGHLMVGKLIACWRPEQVEYLLPVPMYEPKLQARGYNQAELLARSIAKHLQRPVLAEGLTRVKPTGVQAKLGRSSRRHNLEGAILPGQQSQYVQGAKVVLVDDVLTTGSTVNECARILLTAGAQEVRVLVLAAGIYIERSEVYELTQL